MMKSLFALICLSQILAHRDRFYLRLDRMPKVKDELLNESGHMFIQKQLGRGQFATVFKAYWEQGKRSVAIKVEEPREVFDDDIEKSGFNPNTMDDEAHEQHGRVPKVYTAVMDGDFQYVVMQFVGKSLDYKLREWKNRAPSRFVLPMALQLLDRLRALHEKGYLMNDLHLGNICLDESEGKVYLIDLAYAIRYQIKGKHIPDIPLFPFKFSRSRRDELKWFLRLLVKSITGTLYWRDTPIEDVCKDHTAWLKPAFAYVYKLEFEADPDYNHLAYLLHKSYE